MDLTPVVRDLVFPSARAETRVKPAVHFPHAHADLAAPPAPAAHAAPPAPAAPAAQGAGAKPADPFAF